MASKLTSLLCFSLFCLRAVGATHVASRQDLPANVRPFQLDLSRGVPRMRKLIRDYRLPEEPQYPGVGGSKGIDLEVLRNLQNEWLDDFDWKKEEEYLNGFPHFTTTIEGLKIHFLHQKSEHPDSIPILLTHGWPGSFLEFLPMLDALTQRGKTSTGQDVSFHVVIPSLPGVTFSDRVPGNWTLDDSARVFDKLMTEVLGYKTYAAHGTSNGALLTWTLYDSFNKTTRAAHFPLLPFYSTTPDELAAENITITPTERFIHERAMEWTNNGTGYFLMHIFRPNTIGLAVYDSPMGQLAWAGEKWLSWGEARLGQAPNLLTTHEILRSLSLYFLTDSFIPSLYTYAQDPNVLVKGFTKAQTDAPMFITYMRYSIGFWPQEILRRMGNLVSYKVHEFGGFFAGLENVPDFTADLREIRNFWTS